MFQHGPFLGKKQRARRALEDADALGQQVLVEVRGQEGLVREDGVAHGALVDHPGGGEHSAEPRRHGPPSARPARPPGSLGLLRVEAGVLGVEVGVRAGCGLEGHGADGALVENLAVGRLDVGLDGVHSPEHHCTAGAPWGGHEGSVVTPMPPAASAASGTGWGSSEGGTGGAVEPPAPREACQGRAGAPGPRSLPWWGRRTGGARAASASTPGTGD